MPTINAFYANDQHFVGLKRISKALKELVAAELTCGDIALQSDEVSLRLIKVDGDGMLAEIELEVTAHAFEERIKKQDEICLELRTFLKNNIDVQEIRVWLILAELGHSWE